MEPLTESAFDSSIGTPPIPSSDSTTVTSHACSSSRTFFPPIDLTTGRDRLPKRSTQRLMRIYHKQRREDAARQAQGQETALLSSLLSSPHAPSSSIESHDDVMEVPLESPGNRIVPASSSLPLATSFAPPSLAQPLLTLASAATELANQSNPPPTSASSSSSSSSSCIRPARRQKSRLHANTDASIEHNKPLGPFGGRGNHRLLEDSEIDKLLELIVAPFDQQQRQLVRLHCLASCSMDSWADIHMHGLVTAIATPGEVCPFGSLTIAAAASSPTYMTARSTRSKSKLQTAVPLIFLSPLHVVLGNHAEHWILLMINVASRQVVLIDPLPEPDDAEEEREEKAGQELTFVSDVSALSSRLSKIRQWLLESLPAAERIRPLQFRSVHLGVQHDDYNCGLWLVVIVQEWIKLVQNSQDADLDLIVPPLAQDVAIRKQRTIFSNMLYGAPSIAK